MPSVEQIANDLDVEVIERFMPSKRSSADHSVESSSSGAYLIPVVGLFDEVTDKLPEVVVELAAIDIRVEA
jgi:hypothetical protein